MLNQTRGNCKALHVRRGWGWGRNGDNFDTVEKALCLESQDLSRSQILPSLVVGTQEHRIDVYIWGFFSLLDIYKNIYILNFIYLKRKGRECVCTSMG